MPSVCRAPGEAAVEYYDLGAGLAPQEHVFLAVSSGPAARRSAIGAEANPDVTRVRERLQLAARGR
jgi:hypothetical protein